MRGLKWKIIWKIITLSPSPADRDMSRHPKRARKSGKLASRGIVGLVPQYKRPSRAVASPQRQFVSIGPDKWRRSATASASAFEQVKADQKGSWAFTFAVLQVCWERAALPLPLAKPAGIELLGVRTRKCTLCPFRANEFVFSAERRSVPPRPRKPIHESWMRGRALPPNPARRLFHQLFESVTYKPVAALTEAEQWRFRVGIAISAPSRLMGSLSLLWADDARSRSHCPSHA